MVERLSVCDGHGIANAYSELNDPITQRQRFLEPAEDGDEKRTVMDDIDVHAR